MEAVRKELVVEEDGQILVTDLPVKRGERVKVTVETEEGVSRRRSMKVRELLESPLIGLWADRTDIGDSSEFARKLRERAQRREDRR